MGIWNISYMPKFSSHFGMTFLNSNPMIFFGWHKKYYFLALKSDPCGPRPRQTSADSTFRVLSLSRLSTIRIPSVSILSAVQILRKNAVWCLSVWIFLSRFCPDFRKTAVSCPSVRPDKDKTQVSGLSVSLSVDV